MIICEMTPQSFDFQTFDARRRYLPRYILNQTIPWNEIWKSSLTFTGPELNMILHFVTVFGQVLFDPQFYDLKFWWLQDALIVLSDAILVKLNNGQGEY